MAKQFGGSQAFPVTAHCNQLGLTKLEYFTAMAMQGILANSPDWSETEQAKKWVAVHSVEYATETLKELDKL